MKKFVALCNKLKAEKNDIVEYLPKEEDDKGSQGFLRYENDKGIIVRGVNLGNQSFNIEFDKLKQAAKVNDYPCGFTSGKLFIGNNGYKALPIENHAPFEGWEEVEGQDHQRVYDTLAKYNQVAFSASKDSTKPIICGVFFGRGYAAATDTYRMAWIETEDIGEWVLPIEALKCLDTKGWQRSAAVFSHAEKGQAIAVSEYGFDLMIKPIDGNFVQLERIIEPYKEHLEDFENMHDLSVLVFKEITAAINKMDGSMLLDGSKIIVKLDEIEFYTNLTEEYNLPEVRLNPGYLNDWLETIPGILCHMYKPEDKYAAVLFVGEAANYLLMPMVLEYGK